MHNSCYRGHTRHIPPLNHESSRVVKRRAPSLTFHRRPHNDRGTFVLPSSASRAPSSSLVNVYTDRSDMLSCVGGGKIRSRIGPSAVFFTKGFGGSCVDDMQSRKFPGKSPLSRSLCHNRRVASNALSTSPRRAFSYSRNI
jgi:hypothetical protein